MKKIFYIIINLYILQGTMMGAIIDKIDIKGKTIPLIFEKHKSLPIFNLQLVFKNSGYVNDGNKTGLTSLSANLLNEGTKKDGSVGFANKLESKAISIDTSYGFETFVIEVSCLKSEYKTALKYLKQLLKDPNLTQDSLDKLKILQLSKLEQKENDYDYLAKKQLKKILFKNTPLENDSLGNKKTIQDISLEDIKNNLNKIFNINNLIVVAGGKFELEEIKESIKPIVSIMKKTTNNNELKQFRVSKNTATKILKKETKQAYIYFGSEYLINVNDKDVYKAKVASFILGESGFGSRLMEEIRVKNGLAYSAYGYISINKSHTYFTGYLQTKIENQDKAKQLVIKTINDFVKNGVTQEELDGAKKFLSGSEPLRTETFSQRLSRAYHLFYKGLDQDYPKKELQKINNLTLKELNSFIKKHSEILKLSFSIVTK